MSQSMSSGAPGRMAVILAVFVVAAGYGILLPILPSVVGQLTSSAAGAAKHTGILLGLYLLSLAIFAPLWGQVSDRIGRRPVLLVGLIGLGTSVLILSTGPNLASFYVERFLSGMFAAGIVPVALATMGETASTEQQRARRISWVSMASVSGFLLGPMLGGAIAGFLDASDSLASAQEAALKVALLLIAGLSMVAALAVYLSVQPASEKQISSRSPRNPSGLDGMFVFLLALSFVAAGGLGVFEVGLTLQAKQALGMTPLQLALVFSECSLTMFLAQAIVFSPVWKADVSPWFITPTLLLMAVGIAAIPWTSNLPLLFVWVGLVAVGAGVLFPVLTYWVSRRAKENQGADIGKQTAATNLGQALGTGAGGALFGGSFVPGVSFIATAALLVMSAAVGVALSRTLSRSVPAVPRALPSTFVS